MHLADIRFKALTLMHEIFWQIYIIPLETQN